MVSRHRVLREDVGIDPRDLSVATERSCVGDTAVHAKTRRLAAANAATRAEGSSPGAA